MDEPQRPDYRAPLGELPRRGSDGSGLGGGGGDGSGGTGGGSGSGYGDDDMEMEDQLMTQAIQESMGAGMVGAAGGAMGGAGGGAMGGAGRGGTPGGRRAPITIDDELEDEDDMIAPEDDMARAIRESMGGAAPVRSGGARAPREFERDNRPPPGAAQDLMFSNQVRTDALYLPRHQTRFQPSFSHVIERDFNPRFLSCITSYDVASTIHDG
jgi:hypothetical protein